MTGLFAFSSSVAPPSSATGAELEVKIEPPHRPRPIARPRVQRFIWPVDPAERIARITNQCLGSGAAGRPTKNRLLKVAQFRVMYADHTHAEMHDCSIFRSSLYTECNSWNLSTGDQTNVEDIVHFYSSKRPQAWQ